jgi:hypothetical protein
MIIRIKFDAKRTLTILMLVLSMFIVSYSAHAITRSCNANYKIDPRNNALNVIYSGTFSASAGCGKFVPNRCRIRARKKLQKCMKTHWNLKNKRYAPEACRNVRNYPFSNLNKQLKNYICNTYKVRNMHVDIYAHTYGRERCRGNIQLRRNLYIDCNKRHHRR